MKRQIIDVGARQAVLHEYGVVNRAFLLWTPPVNPHAARRKELSDIIDSWGVTVAPAKPYNLESECFRLDMKPQQLQRDMGPAAQALFFEEFTAHRVVGENGKARAFDPFEVFAVTQGDVITHLGKPVLDRIAPQQRTGKRKFVVLEKGQPAKTKAA